LSPFQFLHCPLKALDKLSLHFLFTSALANFRLFYTCQGFGQHLDILERDIFLSPCFPIFRQIPQEVDFSSRQYGRPVSAIDMMLVILDRIIEIYNSESKKNHRPYLENGV